MIASLAKYFNSLIKTDFIEINDLNFQNEFLDNIYIRI